MSEVDVKTKLCIRCKETKPYSEYFKHGTSKDGLQCWCKKCTIKKNKENSTTHRERYLEQKHREYQKHKDKYAEYRKMYREKHKEELRLKMQSPEVKQRKRDYYLKRSYGITFKEKETIIKNQNGFCLICNRTFDAALPTEIHVDHDHVTGNIRGVLCRFCNNILGYCGDSVEVLENAIKYLKNNKV